MSPDAPVTFIPIKPSDADVDFNKWVELIYRDFFNRKMREAFRIPESYLQHVERRPDPLAALPIIRTALRLANLRLQGGHP